MSASDLIGGSYDPERQIDPKDIPDEIELMLAGWQHRQDDRGKMAYFCLFNTRDHKEINQKYSRMHTGVLGEALVKLGLEGLDFLLAKWAKYEQVEFNMGFPRLIPVDILDS